MVPAFVSYSRAAEKFVVTMRGVHFGALLASLVCGASGIVWRADKPASDFNVANSKYPAVFAFPKYGSCAATLIDATHALTAAHCFSPGTAGVTPPFSVT